jgi:hypothetical protein
MGQSLFVPPLTPPRLAIGLPPSFTLVLHDVIQIIDCFHILRIGFIGTFRHDRKIRGQMQKVTKCLK